MKKKLTDNVTLKVLSLVIGFLLWLVVANIDNPVIVRSYTLQTVELLNEAYIDDTGMVCLRNGDTTQVRVTITGTRKLLSNITAADIHLTADLQQAVSLETDPVMIPITATVAGIAASSIEVYPANLSVTLEPKVTQEFMVTISNGDSTPGSGYDIGSQIASPEKLRITGPRSLVNKIDKVIASIRVDGITSAKTEEAQITILDKNGDALTDQQLSNLRFSNDGRVMVSTTVWKTRTDVALDVAWFGVPQEGYVVSEVSTVPSTITVAGTTEALEALKANGNTIRIEDEAVDVSDESSDVEKKISISSYLPEGLRLTTGSGDEVLVTVTILPDGSQKFSISTSSIRVNNLPEDYQIAFDVDKVELRVIAEDDSVAMAAFDVGRIAASIDVKGLSEGTHEVAVDLKLPKGYALISDVVTEVTVSEISTTEDSEE